MLKPLGHQYQLRVVLTYELISVITQILETDLPKMLSLTQYLCIFLNDFTSALPPFELESWVNQPYVRGNMVSRSAAPILSFLTC